jgi:hypothetical protein
LLFRSSYLHMPDPKSSELEFRSLTDAEERGVAPFTYAEVSVVPALRAHVMVSVPIRIGPCRP